MSEKIDLSIVVPACNEKENIPELYRRLSAALALTGRSWEVIFVDDGSADGTFEEISLLRAKDQRVKGISFSRNFGHMPALTAGLDHARGDAVITMDADLQHPPELIPKLIEKWKGGAEVVNTIRKETKSAGIFKKFSAGLFYWLINRIARISLPASAADYRLMDRKVVETLKQLHERSRFLRGLVGWVGFKQEYVEYEADARFGGKTKYSFGRMLTFALDGITSFSSFPLRVSTYLGLIMAFFSFMYILYAVYIRLFTSQAIAGWTSVLVAVLLIGGIQLIFLGVIGEYLGRVYEETKQRPLYIISRKVGW